MNRSHHENLTLRRSRILRQACRSLANDADRILGLLESEQRTDPLESLTAELIPLCSAMKWISRQAPQVLKQKKLGSFGRPLWMTGVHHFVQRQPHGTVLVLGPWNYPLFLPGVQSIAAWVAGNRTLLKPAVGAEAITAAFAEHLYDAGVKPADFEILDSSVQAATDAMDQGVDFVVLTGSATTARSVLSRCTGSMTPAIIEASGCDAVLLVDGFDVQRAVELIRFGLMMNSGATCMAPRRIYVPQSENLPLQSKIQESMEAWGEVVVHPAAREAIARAVDTSLESGAELFPGCNWQTSPFLETGRTKPIVFRRVESSMPVVNEDLFGPVVSLLPYADAADAVAEINQSRFRLSASVIGPEKSASALANQINVGTVVVNDVIVPSADPRVTFGGRDESGYGVTRGAEGLLAMTKPRTISIRRGSWLPHLRPRTDGDLGLLKRALRFLYG